MSLQDEDRRAKPARELLESQRRRASFSSWLMLGLGVGLLIAGVYIGLGNVAGDLENGPAGLVLKKLHGPVPALLWAPTILFCFRQFRRDRERARELENRQNRDRLIRRYPDPKMSAEDAIRLLESGAGMPKPPLPDKPPTAGIVIRVKQSEREIKSINPPVRRGLPASSRPEDPREK
jgi:hypothetical protein